MIQDDEEEAPELFIFFLLFIAFLMFTHKGNAEKMVGKAIFF